MPFRKTLINVMHELILVEPKFKVFKLAKVPIKEDFRLDLKTQLFQLF